MAKRIVLISIVGRPNVGKSTLLNAIMGQKIAIVSEKPQTTRNRISGIETRGEDQYIFLDTPGIFKGKSPLDDFMVKTADSAMKDGDVVILVADASYRPGDVECNIIDYLKKSHRPCILVLNKVDLVRREQLARTIQAYANEYSFDAVVPISAKKRKYVDEVMAECAKFLHEGDWLYEEDDITDQTLRQMTSELVREKILRTVDKEVPHGVAVVIEEFKYNEDNTKVNIRAEIFVEKESHKGILVGKGGESLKRIGTYAREELEKMLSCSVYLDLWVRVKENWRDSVASVTNFGYQDK